MWFWGTKIQMKAVHTLLISLLLATSDCNLHISSLGKLSGMECHFYITLPIEDTPRRKLVCPLKIPSLIISMFVLPYDFLSNRVILLKILKRQIGINSILSFAAKLKPQVRRTSMSKKSNGRWIIQATCRVNNGEKSIFPPYFSKEIIEQRRRTQAIQYFIQEWRLDWFKGYSQII